MKNPAPFSKEIIHDTTVHNDEDGCREGFSEYQTITKLPHREPIKNMAGFHGESGQTKAGGNPAHPEFKSRSDDGMPSHPAPFSKKNIPGTPKRTPGH